MIRSVVFAACLGNLFVNAPTQRSQSPVVQNDTGKTYTLDRNVRAVVLDATVTDRQGRPVPRLTAADFLVTEDGVPQRVDFFQNMGEHAVPAAARTGGKQGTTLLKSSGDSPLTVLLLDHISTEPEDPGFAKKQIASYLRGQGAALNSPTALMALTGSSLVTLCDYTLDRDTLVAAMAKDRDTSSWYVLRDRQPGMKSTNLNSSGERLAI